MNYTVKEQKVSKDTSNLLFLLNQIFEIENKVERLTEANSIHRNVKKLKEFFEQGELTGGSQLKIENPIGEKYSDTRTDVEASISGASLDDLEIIDVIKPIIRLKINNKSSIFQKAIVIVESRKGNEHE
jgi:hypothetical protein